MAVLNNLTVSCGKPNPPGTLIEFYYAPSCELTGFPQTRAEVNAGTDPGDTKILDEPFDFSNAPTGQGYWRKAKLLVDTGEVRDVLEGELGGQGFKSSINGFIVGTDAEHLEFADCLVNYSGQLVCMLADIQGNYRVLGNDKRPAMVEAAEGTTGIQVGDRRGFAYTFSAFTGKTAPIYDAETHAIEVTPNV